MKKIIYLLAILAGFYLTFSEKEKLEPATIVAHSCGAHCSHSIPLIESLDIIPNAIERNPIHTVTEKSSYSTTNNIDGDDGYEEISDDEENQTIEEQYPTDYSIFLYPENSETLPPSKNEYWISRKKVVQIDSNVFKKDIFRFNPFKNNDYLISVEGIKTVGNQTNILKGKAVKGSGNEDIGKFTLVSVTDKKGNNGYYGNLKLKNGKTFIIKGAEDNSEEIIVEELKIGEHPPIMCSTKE